MLNGVREGGKESDDMNIDDFIKEENDEIRKRQKETDERKKSEMERAKMELLAALGIGEKIYGNGAMVGGVSAADRNEYPFWDNVTWRPYKVKIDVSDEEFARLLEHLRQTDNPHYKRYLKQIRKIEEGDKPMAKSYKIILTIVSVVVFVVLSAVVTGIRTDAGFKTSGIFGLILLSALIFVLHSIWKKNNK